MAPGAYEKAVALAEKERVKNPDYARLRSILARYYARLGRESAALLEIAEARQLGPRDVDIMYRSVLVYEALERRKEALEAAEAALRNGFSCELMRDGPDLAALRQDHRYQRIEEMHCDSG